LRRNSSRRWLLSSLAADDFSPTYLRNATAYGASPRLRLDIVVNNLTGVAVTTGNVHLESDGTPWRPLVHVEDISRACLAVMEAPRHVIHDQAFNVGRDADNVQVAEIAGMVVNAVSGSKVTLAAGAGPDLRSYLVDFSKFADTFPTVELAWTVPAGVAELVESYAEHGMTREEFASARFVRLRRIEELRSGSLVDELLCRQSAADFASVGLPVLHGAQP
jgi:nucleoside-diphosphate-sugar epimerase